MNGSDAWMVLVLVGFVASLGAGVVRGFAGFGFSALTVASISLFMSPSAVVPAVLVLEVLASFSIWRSAMRDLDKTWLKSLMAGNLFMVPLGAYLLAYLAPIVVRLVVGLALLFTGLGLRLRLRSGAALSSSPVVQASTGCLSGFLNGVAASGGIAAAMLMTGCHVPALAMRGTLIIYLALASAYAIFWAIIYSFGAGSGVDVLSMNTLRWILILAPGMLLGTWLGRLAFARSDPQNFRPLVLNLLIAMSALGVARAQFDGFWIR